MKTKLPFPVYDMSDPVDAAQYHLLRGDEDKKPVSISDALRKPKAVMTDEVKQKLAAAKAERKATRTRTPALEPRAKAEPKPIKTFLLDPVITYKPNGKVDLITGTCPECRTNRRSIHLADAFQVRRCKECQARKSAPKRKEVEQP